MPAMPCWHGLGCAFGGPEHLEDQMKKLIAAALVAAASVGLVSAASAGTLDNVKAKGQLVCGANPGTAGFGVPDQKGNWTGLDVDYCRAIAAAIFNDPTKVKFVPLSSKDRFTALASGEVDVLIRNSTWTMSRETTLGIIWAGVNFYDGQGFMVNKKLNVKSAKELNGASICVQQGTTTELNLADYFRSNKMDYKVVTFGTSEEALKAYDSGRCDSYTTDRSGLAADRLSMAKPDDHIILPEVISKEPLGPVVRQGDDQWLNLVKWVHYALITTEELGITSKNVDEQVKSDNPEIKRVLGTEGKFGESLGLSNAWVVQIVKGVGNYEEIFERNVGPNTPIQLARSSNALWSKGGLQYAPPIR
jgi:general L-amino acid transport system substrate-binding protein